jgi:hypothetical protein
MTRRSPPRAYGTTLLGHRRGSGHSYAPMDFRVAQLYLLHLWYFLVAAETALESNRPLAHSSLGAINSERMFEFPPVPLFAASRGSDLYMSRLSLFTPRFPSSDHNCQGPPSTTPVHYTNGTMPQYDDGSTCLVTNDGVLLAPSDWTDGKRGNPTHTPQEMRGTRSNCLVSP